jgi:UDP-N-acetylglucosamine 4-epimerase
MSPYEKLQEELKAAPKTWLITGCAGFIGSNLLEKLLKLNQRVVGLDNFSTGYNKNLAEVQTLVTPEQWSHFHLVKGDICDPHACKVACENVDLVLHQAALGSVPASIEHPIRSHQSNVDGFLNIITAARDAKVKRFVYASSSAIYGDEPELPKVEEKIGRPLSPYAAHKWMNEIYAEVYARCYAFESIGLRYFNVFGPRQDPDGAYAAVIPKWLASMIKAESIFINGDGETSRDFCFIDNVVQANLLAATTQTPGAANRAYNVAVGERTTLNQMFKFLNEGLRKRDPNLAEQKPVYREFRAGDVRHSLASVDKAKAFLGFQPSHSTQSGLESALDWYLAHV